MILVKGWKKSSFQRFHKNSHRLTIYFYFKKDTTSMLHVPFIKIFTQHDDTVISFYWSTNDWLTWLTPPITQLQQNLPSTLRLNSVTCSDAGTEVLTGLRLHLHIMRRADNRAAVSGSTLGSIVAKGASGRSLYPTTKSNLFSPRDTAMRASKITLTCLMS